MPQTDFDSLVIGAGAVGLATAAELAERGQSVLVLEAGPQPGEGTTARNSEVIHAGLYYPTGSLKHALCVTGRRRLYDFLRDQNVGHAKCGKLVVASDAAEEERLSEILERGRANGVEGLRLLSRREVTARAPELRASAALWSPETGIFDSHGYLVQLIAWLEARGGLLVLRTPVTGVTPIPGGYAVDTGGAEPTRITTRRLVNAAGLWAPGLAERIAGLPAENRPRQWLAKGCYFRFTGRSPFDCLIYPVPVDGGLGIHATLDLGGALRFGPDVDWLPEGTGPESIDYGVDPARAEAFETAIRRYWPGLPEGRLEPDYSGVRPKLRGPGGGAFDFEIQTEGAHGLPGLVNLFGIESPGLTASLAIGARVAEGLVES
ncbi:NAD(P)/FAD-dependent oxidoreductase [Roseivivax sp.]